MQWQETEINWYLLEFLGVKSRRVYNNFWADFSHLEPQCAMKSSFILVLSLCATLTITEASGNRLVFVNFCPVKNVWSKISKHRVENEYSSTGYLTLNWTLSICSDRLKSLSKILFESSFWILRFLVFRKVTSAGLSSLRQFIMSSSMWDTL